MRCGRGRGPDHSWEGLGLFPRDRESSEGLSSESGGADKGMRKMALGLELEGSVWRGELQGRGGLGRAPTSAVSVRQGSGTAV